MLKKDVAHGMVVFQVFVVTAIKYVMMEPQVQVVHVVEEVVVQVLAAQDQVHQLQGKPIHQVILMGVPIKML